METFRSKDGTITVQAKGFSATISEDGIRVLVGTAIAHEWKCDTLATLAAIPESHRQAVTKVPSCVEKARCPVSLCRTRKKKT
jgi:hypothetical protein